MSKKSIFGILLFYVIAVGIRYFTNESGFLSYINNSFFKIIIQASGPAIGALVAVKTFKLNFSMTLRGVYKKGIIPLIIYWLIPIIFIVVSSYIMNGNFVFSTVMAILIYGLLEEIGWRGFLRQQLKNKPKIVNILIVTTMWFIWHLNFELTVDNFIFFIILGIGSWGIGFVADKTNSLLAIASFHSINNFYDEWNIQHLTIIFCLVFIWILAIIYETKIAKRNCKEFLN